MSDAVINFHILSYTDGNKKLPVDNRFLEFITFPIKFWKFLQFSVTSIVTTLVVLNWSFKKSALWDDSMHAVTER